MCGKGDPTAVNAKGWVIYQAWNPRADTLALVHQAAAILDDYQRRGYDMTLRQLYYQLVSANAIPNSLRSYQRLSEVMTKARWAGMVPVDCLYDPGRITRPDLRHGAARRPWSLEHRAEQYATDRWRNAETRVELWAEKDAVMSVLWPVAFEWRVTYQSARGFMGLGAMAAVRERFDRYFGMGQDVGIIYCGDHDPSGQEIPRVVQDQLARLLANTDSDPYGYRNITVRSWP